MSEPVVKQVLHFEAPVVEWAKLEGKNDYWLLTLTEGNVEVKAYLTEESFLQVIAMVEKKSNE